MIGIYPTINDDYKLIIKEYQQLQVNINSLKEQYKKASMKSEKIDIDDQIFNEEQKQNKLLDKLRGETSGIK